METKFNDTFNKYIEDKDKFESLYIFVIYDFPKEEIEEKFIKIFKQLDGINDSKRKGFLKSRIYDFKKNIDSVPAKFINGIFLVGETVKHFELDKYYLETLKMFKVPKFNFEFGKNYNIKWLKNLLLDRSYVNVLKVKNNDLSILKFNSTKQLITYSETQKSMNLQEIINTKLDKDIKFLIHGVKQLNDYKNKNCLGIFTKELTLEEISEIIDKSIYEENIKELEVWLTKLLDPKEGHKIVFGNNIELNIIETIYCTPENEEKYSKFENVKIKLVKSYKNGDIIFNFSKNFNGVLGIKYY
jgi:hypothetical protein